MPRPLLYPTHILTSGVGSSDFSHALTRLTGPQSTITSFSSVMYSSSSRLEFGSEFEPISDEDIDMVLQVGVVN